MILENCPVTILFISVQYNTVQYHSLPLLRSNCHRTAIWWLCMVINLSVTVERWASPRHYTVDSRLLPSGNPFKYHVVALSLQPTWYVTVYYSYHVGWCTKLFLFCFFWCPCIAINVSVQHYNGGLLPDMILLIQYYYNTIGEPV